MLGKRARPVREGVVGSGPAPLDHARRPTSLVGPYRNGGAEWRPAGQPEQGKGHDFIDPAPGKANPYGVYDLAADTGWGSVGAHHDTPPVALETIRRRGGSPPPPPHPHAARPPV